MRIAIIGAGVSGLAAARQLSGQHCVKVFETAGKPGGLVSCDVVEGSLFHKTGGHVFNTKHQDVLELFWSWFDRDVEFVKADRNAAIVMRDGNIVGYPIENHVYQLGDDVLRPFIADIMALATDATNAPSNFEDFLKAKFGHTLYELYFGPYNRKVWHQELSDVPLAWLEGKLPMPTASEMLYNNIRRAEEREFVHSTFYYPVSGGSQFIADRMATGVDVIYNTPVTSINRVGDKWQIRGETFDCVIFTGNLKSLPGMLSEDLISDALSDAISDLKSHGTTSVFCEIDRNPYSWIYLPDDRYDAHRIICTGNFARSNNRSPRLTATVEFTDYVSIEDIKDNLSRIPYHPNYLSHNWEQYTYPIQSHDTRGMVMEVKRVLNPLSLFLLGRFAEWEYYNMDAAIAAAMRCVDTIEHK